MILYYLEPEEYIMQVKLAFNYYKCKCATTTIFLLLKLYDLQLQLVLYFTIADSCLPLPFALWSFASFQVMLTFFIISYSLLNEQLTYKFYISFLSSSIWLKKMMTFRVFGKAAWLYSEWFSILLLSGARKPQLLDWEKL